LGKEKDHCVLGESAFRKHRALFTVEKYAGSFRFALWWIHQWLPGERITHFSTGESVSGKENSDSPAGKSFPGEQNSHLSTNRLISP
jgi:hypothetical protein